MHISQKYKAFFYRLATKHFSLFILVQKEFIKLGKSVMLLNCNLKDKALLYSHTQSPFKKIATMKFSTIIVQTVLH